MIATQYFLIPKSRENNQSDVYDGTWREMADDSQRIKDYGSNTLERVKEGATYIIIGYGDTSVSEEISVTKEEYFNFGFETIEEDE